MTEADVVSGTTGGFWDTLDAISVGDVVSGTTGGFWTGLIALTGNKSTLPGPKTTMTLYAKTVTQSASLSPVVSWGAVQTIDGSLQPLNGKESAEYNKETVIANYKFIVGQSVFLSSANEAKLIEKNQIRYGSRIFDIVFVSNRTEGFLPHYSVILKEVL